MIETSQMNRWLVVLLQLLAAGVLIFSAHQLVLAPPVVPDRQNDQTNTGPSAASRPQYTYDLTYDRSSNTLSGTGLVQWQLKPYLSATNGTPLEQVLFRTLLNAFDPGFSGPPVLERFHPSVFPNGRQYGSIEMSQATVNGQKAQVIQEGTLTRLKPAGPQLSFTTPGNRLNIQFQLEARIPGIRYRMGRDDHSVWLGNVLPVLVPLQPDGPAPPTYTPVGEMSFSPVSDYRVEFQPPEGTRLLATGRPVNRAATRWSAEKVREWIPVLVDGSYRKLTGDAGSTRVSLFYRQISPQQAEDALETAVEATRFFSRRAGEPDDRTIVAVESDLFITGMEFPGLVLVRKDVLAGRHESLVHELAHQWFYAGVGNDPVKHAWLDEGWATFMTDWFFHQQDLEAHYEQLWARYAGSIRGVPHTLATPTTAFQDWSSYWLIHYRKGALLLFALRQQLGAQSFAVAVSDYYSTFEGRQVTPEAFVRFFRKRAKEAGPESAERVDDLFERWLQQTGLPPFPEGPEN